MTSVAQVLQRATETNVPLCVSKPVTAVCYKPGLLPLGGFPFNYVDLNIVKKVIAALAGYLRGCGTSF